MTASIADYKEFVRAQRRRARVRAALNAATDPRPDFKEQSPNPAEQHGGYRPLIYLTRQS